MQLRPGGLRAGRAALRAGSRHRDLPFEENDLLRAGTAARSIGAGEYRRRRGKAHHKAGRPRRNPMPRQAPRAFQKFGRILERIAHGHVLTSSG